jgi:hypothetical protein
VETEGRQADADYQIRIKVQVSEEVDERQGSPKTLILVRQQPLGKMEGRNIGSNLR